MNAERIISPEEEERIRTEVRRELAERQAQEQQRREERMQQEQSKARHQEIERIRRDEENRFNLARREYDPGTASGLPQTHRHRHKHHSRTSILVDYLKEIVLAGVFLSALIALYVYYKR